MSNHRLWYYLIDETGRNYHNSTGSTVTIPPYATLFQFKEAVKDKCLCSLYSINASQLLVYENKAAFFGKQKPLNFIDPKYGYGSTLENGLAVLRPQVATERETKKEILLSLIEYCEISRISGKEIEYLLKSSLVLHTLVDYPKLFKSQVSILLSDVTMRCKRN